MAVHWFAGWARYMLGRSLAPSYVPSPAAAGLAMLKLAELRAGETLVDLGCGDGRLLKLAVTDFNASSAIGYEMDPGLAKTARSTVASPFTNEMPSRPSHPWLPLMSSLCISLRAAMRSCCQCSGAHSPNLGLE